MRKTLKEAKIHEFGMTNTGQDRISNLPVEIIRQIQSHLPRKDAARTCVLSHLWLNIWVSRPIIYLHEWHFGAHEKEKRHVFLTYLEKFLDNRHKAEHYGSAVDALFLKMTVWNSSAESLVEKWIRFALKNKVKTLCLYLTYLEDFNLPSIAFIAATLVELTIYGCDISNCSFKLPNLRSLNLSCVCVEDDDFKNLLAGCPRIQELRISGCKKLHNIVVSNPTLKHFGAYPFGGKILIESTNLESLLFGCFGEGMREVEITSTATVRNLTLQWVNDKDRALMHFINTFPQLEKLAIQIGCSNLQVSHQHLTSFVLEFCNYQVEEVIMDAPKLKYLEVLGGALTLFPGIEASRELEFVKFILKPKRLDDHWYIWLRSILESFAHTKRLSLICRSERDIIFPDKLTERLLPTINDLKNLELQIDSSTATSQQILDGFVWMLPGLKRLSLTLGSISKLIEFPQ